MEIAAVRSRRIKPKKRTEFFQQRRARRVVILALAYRSAEPLARVSLGTEYKIGYSILNR